MKRIDTMFAFIMEDERDDHEGIPAMLDPTGMLMPLVGADEDRIKSLMPIAKDLAKKYGKTIRLFRFHTRELLEEIEP